MTTAAIPRDGTTSILDEIAEGKGLTLGEASRGLAGSTQSRKTCPSTLWRWATSGVYTPSGILIRLEVARVGCRWYTTEAAIRRFLVAQNQTPAAAETPALASA